ncbi:Epidermal growth factor receptor kinase substrate 8 [Halotydeus destructor]|nr:Epidermal growth factor receptor kinase substrate 8 [Halotydeus destructor]
MASSPSSSSSSTKSLYSVEHLATFSTSSPHQQQTTPKMALQRLFAMEKTSGIWTQRMSLLIEGNKINIIDGDSSEIVERFPVTLIHQPTAFNHSNHIYDNILIFTVQHPEESQGELHIFQCSSHSAQQVVSEIESWMRRHGNNNTAQVNSAGQSSSADPNSAANINVKEAVHVFNAIAAQRETRKSVSPVVGSQPVSSRVNGTRDQDSRSITTTSSIESSSHNGGGGGGGNGGVALRTNGNHEQSLSNERYVSILNHCFDDIERFIIRLQHAAAALRELQLRNHKRGKGPQHAGDGLLAMRARGPTEEEFFEILSKFKLAFNLLAKLKGCIHDPNAPELIHFLFTPLAIIIEAARGNGPVPVEPAAVGMPYLNSEAVELLSNCCTSKEYDLWQSLGPNWSQPARQHIVQPSRVHVASYQPVFTDGWAPTITEPELIGFTSSSDASDDEAIPIPVHVHRHEEHVRRSQHFDDSEEEVLHHHLDHHRPPPVALSHPPPGQHRLGHSSSPSPIDSIGRGSPSVAPITDVEQSDWLQQLHERNAKIVRVLFPRAANNDKELTVIRGEILEVIDDTRKWWKARNWRGHIAHVPHTIVQEISPSGGRDSRGSHGGASPSEDWLRKERLEPKRSVIGSSELTPLMSPLSSQAKPSTHEGAGSQARKGDKEEPEVIKTTPTTGNFQEELMETLKKRAQKRNRLSLPLIASHLFNKGFNRELIAHLMAIVCVLCSKVTVRVDPCDMLLKANKDQLAIFMADHPSITDEEITELYRALQELSQNKSNMKIIPV